MNIYRFKIEVKSKKNQFDMEMVIRDCFKRHSTKGQNYKSYIKKTWNDEKDEIKALFTESQILALVREDRLRYYVAKVNDNDDPHKIQLDILVISYAEKINDSIKRVDSSLRKKLEGYTVTISDNVANLYITRDDNILSIDLAIKANVVVKLFNFGVREWIRNIAILLLLILSGVFTYYVEDAVFNAVWLSLLTSSIFWIITEVLVKMKVFKELEVNDLTNCISNPQNDESGSSVKLSTPEVSGWGA